MVDGEDKKVSDCADQYAAANWKRISQQITASFSTEKNPVSIFMAGSPGTGKTESSKQLLRNAGHILRIDADELRDHFKACGYNGENSHLFQKATSKLVHKIHDEALKKEISFLLDGTFASESMAEQNIERSLKRGRIVFVVFVYQTPSIAWDFVLNRKEVEGRRIRPEDFAKKFCASREVANKMKEKFQGKIDLMLLSKNINGTNKFFQKSIQRIDDHIPEKYSEEQILKKILNQ